MSIFYFFFILVINFVTILYVRRLFENRNGVTCLLNYIVTNMDGKLRILNNAAYIFFLIFRFILIIRNRIVYEHLCRVIINPSIA